MTPFRALLLAALVLLTSGCEEAADPEPYFLDLETAPSFTYEPGSTGELYFPEVMGGGGALFDYDGDGDLDLYAVQGGAVPGSAHDADGRDRLFRNDSGGGALRFTDVTEDAGLEARGYGMGVSVGDVDNDGHADLYVLNVGANQLWRNLGDGRFEDATVAAEVGDEAWSVGASFADVDGDGWLDLYVANYVDFSVAGHVKCHGALGQEDYCSPLVYRPAGDTVYRNRGDGTFEDLSFSSGIRRAPQNGLGVITLDADADGRLDFYVANDMTPNHLFINQSSGAEGGTFADQGLVAGVAVNGAGKSEASMGVAQADVDRNGELDLFLTHLRGETHTLYSRRGASLYRDETGPAGLARPSVAATGFGLAFLDLEHDGWLDLVIANGAVTAIESLARSGDPRPLHEPDSLFRGVGDGRFEAVPSVLAGAHFERSEIGRGLASGDIDNDGDTDLVIFNNGSPMRILLGTAADRGGRWLGVEVREEIQQAREDSADRPWRIAVGVQVAVDLEGGQRLVSQVSRGGSYAVANDPRCLFGLGQGQPTQIEAVWPDGFVLRVEAPELGRYHLITRSVEAGE